MLTILVDQQYEASWNWDTSEWTCSNETIRKVLQAYFDCEIAPQLSVRDRFLVKSVSGKVFRLLGDLMLDIDLVKLDPEPVGPQEEGVDY